MAVGDQLKLSSDGISAIGGRRSAPEERSEYDAPELAQGESPTASDAWSLGMLLVMALTQRFPDWDTSGKEPLLPANVAGPFDEIARRCLRRDPSARISVEEIAAQLGLPLPAGTTRTKPQLQPNESAPRPTQSPPATTTPPQP